ncbi:MAG: YidC/Oxa1 family membrane protein insertase [Lachnospiraceae bacterium]|nr:YidC/Oxa1 family membrane protein insertase [Lachnospiraceae bacterium]
MQGILLTRANGVLKPICWVLGEIMNGIFNVLDLIGIPNVGLSILLFTLIVYLLMLPLNVRQQKFSKLSAIMNPEIEAIRKKYQGRTDTESMQKQQAETKAVYDKYGVSQTGSCVQLLIQMPILFSLYRIIYAMPAYVDKLKDAYTGLVSKLISVDGVAEILQGFSNSSRYSSQFTNESYLAGDAEYISNTFIDCLNMATPTEWESLAEAFPNLASEINSTYEVISRYNNFLGVNIGNTPANLFSQGFSNGTYLMCFVAILIPVLAAATQWLNTKLMPQSNTGNSSDSTANSMAQSMKTMNMLMPLMSAWFCFSFQIGIGIYWIGGAVFRSIQQVVINKYLDKTLDYQKLIEQNKDKAAQKQEKYKEKQKKRADAYSSLQEQANRNTKKISTRANMAGQPRMTEEEREERMKEVQKYQKNTSAGSIASRANLVRDYNSSSGSASSDGSKTSNNNSGSSKSSNNSKNSGKK